MTNPTTEAAVSAERQAVVAWLRRQADIGADYGLAADKGSARRASYEDKSYALKLAANEVERGGHLDGTPPHPEPEKMEGIVGGEEGGGW